MVADVARRRHAEAAHGGGRQVREDVAEHVLGHDHVVVAGALDEVHRHRVDVGALGLDVGVVGRDLVEERAEEGIALQHVRLVDQRHPAGPVARGAVAPARQLERLAADPEDAGARDDEGVGRDVAADQDARAAGGVEPLGVLAQDDVVDPLALGEPERRRHARVESDGPEAHVEVERDPERELRGDLRSVREADVGQPRGAEEDGVRRLADLQGLARELLARPPVAGGARPPPPRRRDRADRARRPRGGP